MSTLRLVAVTAGMSEPSSTRLLTDRLTAAAGRRLAERDVNVEIETVELRDIALDVAGAMVGGYPSARLRAVLDAVAAADGLVAVTPIFTASYSGLFKSFFDVLGPDVLTGTPTLIAATGGTARHSLALEHAVRPMFAYLRALVVPTAVYAASEDWGNTDGLVARIERAAGELADQLGGRPGTGRVPEAKGAPADEFESVLPFEKRFTAMLGKR